jgi:hypothetical protein
MTLAEAKELEASYPDKFGDKYVGLGRNYALKEIEPPTREKMEYLLSVAEESGLKCQIGG